jgi:PAS domain S-box-containing protein
LGGGERAGAAEWVPTERTDQAWKVTSLVEDGGLAQLNLFNLDFERDERSPRWGTVWIASSQGLHEYDGYTWRRHGKAQGLPSDFVRCVRVTRSGAIWVGTDQGAGIYGGKTFRTLGSETNLAGPNVRRIIEDADGTLWFCSDSWPNTEAGGGLTSFRAGQWRAYREADGLPSGYVVNYFRESGGRQFAATLKGLAELKGGRWEPAFPAPAGLAINWASGCLAEAPGTGLVYSTGTQMFALQDGAWRTLPDEVHHAHGIAATPDGMIVAAGRPNRGRSAFLEWTGTNWMPVSAEFSAPRGYTEDIQVAPDGSVWVAGYDCLVRWARRGSQWREFTDLPPPALVDARGGVWFAEPTWIGRPRRPTVRLFNGQWERLESAHDGLVDDLRDESVWGWSGDRLTRWQGTNRTEITPEQTGLAAYVAGQGDRLRSIWLLGRDAGGAVAVARHTDDRWENVPVPELAGLNLWPSAAAAGNGVWFAGDRGVGTEAVLVRVGTNGNLRLGVELRHVGPMRMDFREDRYGAVWLFGEAGLFRWVPGVSTRWDSFDGLPARSVVSCVERGDELWFGFSGLTGGKSSLVALRRGVWTNFPVATLGHLTVARDGTILADGAGQIFRVSNRPDAVPRPQGLRTPEPARSVVQDHDGNLWVSAGNPTFRFRSDRVPLRTSVTGERLVHADDQLAVEVTALDRFRPRGGRTEVQCSWRLDGGEWQAATAETPIRVPAKALRIGTHRMEVRCADAAGNRLSEPAGLGFEVVPVPLQQRPWFVPALLGLAAAMTTLALVAAAARRKLAEHARSLEQTVADRTAALEADVRRRQLVEERLRASEERFSKAFHSSPLIEVITTYPDGRYVDVNATFVEALGYSREEAVGRYSRDLGIWWDPADRAELIRRLGAGETVRGLEISQRTKSGERMIVEASFERIVVAGQPCILAINIDITERKRSELALRASEARLQEAQRIAKIGSWEWDLLNGRLHWSDETFRLFDLPVDRTQPYYQIYRDRIHPDDVEAVNRAYAEAKASGQPYEIAHRLRFPDGRIKVVQEHGEFEYSAAGEPIRSRGTMQDITERKLAEGALLMMRLSVDRAGDSIFWVRRDGSIRYVNDAACAGRGYSREELLNLAIFDLDPDYPADVWTTHFDELRRQGALTLETRHRTKDGRIFPIEVNANYVCIDGEEFNFCFVRDITRRRRDEAALRAKDELLRLVIDLVPHFIFAKDAQGRFLFANRAVADSAGLSPAQLVGLGPHDLNRDPAEAEAFVRDDLDVIASGRAKFIPEETLTDINGRVRIHQTNKIPFRNPVTGEMALLGTAVDITSVKAAEASIRESEERLRLVTDNARVGLVMINRDHRYTFANGTYAEIMELPAADLAGRRVAEVLGPLYEEQVRPWLERGLAGERVTYELRRQTPQGLRHYSVRYEPRNIGAPTAFVVVVLTDITALKQAEALLRDSEANLSALVTGMRDGLLVADMGTRKFVRANDAVCRMLGYSREEMLSLRVDQIHPSEALAGVLENFRRQAAGELDLAANSPVLRKDGSVFLADISTSPLDVGGRREMVGVFRDVTERQAAAAALAAQEEFGRAILNSLAAHLAVLDSAGTIVEVNEAWNRFARSRGVGSLSEVSVGVNYLEVCRRSIIQGSEDAERAFTGIRSVLAGESRDFHCEYLLDGLEEPRWFQLRVSPLGGARQGVVVAHLDITDRRREEDRRGTEHAVTSVLAGAETLSAATPALLRALCTTEGWEFGELWQVDVALRKLVCVETWCDDEIRFETLRTVIRNLQLEPGQGLPGRAWESGQTISVADLTDDPAFLRREVAWAANLQSATAFPIRAGDRVTAVMAFMSSRPIRPDSAQLEMLAAIGTQIGQFIARKSAEEELRRFVSLSPTVLYALRVTSAGFRALWVSDNILGLTGFTAAEAIGPGWWLDHLHPDDRERVLAANAPGPERDNLVLEFRFLRKDGSHLWLRDERRLVCDAQGNPTEIIGAWSDVTDRMNLEKQLRQSQKMEAIGQLSGGIAHDFNNLLGAIIGNCELARMDLDTTHPATESVDQILAASRRAGHLVEQILTFARVERAEHRRIDPVPVVEESVRLLRSTLPAGVQLVLLRGEGLPAILADETQFQQVLINLGTNAWHALEGGAGRISVELSAATVDALLASGCPDLHPGSYLRIRVEDTGHGMPPAVLERIFEPFFTTKEVGRGTGLGLSVVHGIIRSHGGAIAVESAVGVGTTFDLYLPAAETEAVPGGAHSEAPLRLGHGEQLLLVDDQPEMLRTNQRGLERLGYRVVSLASSAEALARFEAAPADFALLLTDLNMPGMNGVELTRAVLRLRPDLPVILTSGFITEDLRLATLAAGVREVLRKPATLLDLGDALARHLTPVPDAKPHHPAD